MALAYRLAHSGDIPSVAEVFADSIDDLNRTHGFFDGPTPSSPPNPQYAFWLEKDPRAFWVAEEDGRIIGYTFSFVRGHLWFLADLFILPDHQGKGIGGTLIKKTLESWKGNKISDKALITPAFNRTSVSLYMRHGMFPRQPLYFASAPTRSVAQNLEIQQKGDLEVEEMRDFGSAAPALDRLHRLALGFPSGWHNEFFSLVQKAKCILLKRRGRPEGYGYIRPNGRMGPLLVSSESSFRPALTAALRAATELGPEELTMFFPATNEDAALLGIRYGFRVTYPLLFLSSKPMGDWKNYLFYSPGLM